MRPGGINGGTKTAAIDSDQLIYKEVRARWASTQRPKSYRKLIALLERNVDRLTPVHTHDVPLAEAERGIRMVAGEVPGEETICLSIRA